MELGESGQEMFARGNVHVVDVWGTTLKRTNVTIDQKLFHASISFMRQHGEPIDVLCAILYKPKLCSTLSHGSN